MEFGVLVYAYIHINMNVGNFEFLNGISLLLYSIENVILNTMTPHRLSFSLSFPGGSPKHIFKHNSIFQMERK